MITPMVVSLAPSSRTIQHEYTVHPLLKLPEHSTLASMMSRDRLLPTAWRG